MKLNNYFGQIKKDLQGFSSENTFKIPHFDVYNNVNSANKVDSVKVLLGEEYDNEWNKIEIPPTQIQLIKFEQTLKNFLLEIDTIVIDIQEKTFGYYKKYYSEYYEKPFEVLFENEKIREENNEGLHQPLNIDSKEKHFEYMKEILQWIRILENNTIKIPFSYLLDEEHGLELKIVNNKVEAVGRISET